MKALILFFYFRIRQRFEKFIRFYEPRYLEHLYGNKVSIGKQVFLGPNFQLTKLGDESALTIEERYVFRRNTIVTLFLSGKLLIGENNFFNNNCSINCLGQITIGKNNLFGENVKIYDHNHEFSDVNTEIYLQGMKVDSVVIGSNCWIASNTVILNNVVIGDNVVIGANNLIYKSIPSNTVIKANSSYNIHERQPTVAFSS
jgi:acetyltransferase-like isoleucine patch superfamily enzyme